MKYLEIYLHISKIGCNFGCEFRAIFAFKILKCYDY